MTGSQPNGVPWQGPSSFTQKETALESARRSSSFDGWLTSASAATTAGRAADSSASRWDSLQGRNLCVVPGMGS